MLLIEKSSFIRLTFKNVTGTDQVMTLSFAKKVEANRASNVALLKKTGVLRSQCVCATS
jgi:hypothetical protein